MYNCSVCNHSGDFSSHLQCAHAGEWHDNFGACSLSCANRLGLSNLGSCHWSCCGSTEPNSTCANSFHVFELTGGAPVADSKTPLGVQSDCPTYVINLDAPAKERWTHIIKAYESRLDQLLETLDDILGTGSLRSLAETGFAAINKLGMIYYSEEIAGIAAAANLPAGQIAILQIAYEAFAACTSIVTNMNNRPDSDAREQKQKNNDEEVLEPFHIRTMDWDMPALAALTIEVDFVHSNGALDFKATTWPGYVGVLTGMRPGAFSVSVNYRRYIYIYIYV